MPAEHKPNPQEIIIVNIRTATVNRVTKETEVNVKLSLDGGEAKISTGVGFLDHMLDLFAHHGGFGLEVSAKGDIHIDDHHSVEDIGISLGEAFYKAAGEKRGIARYGGISLPMDETLAQVALDFGGRAFLHFDARFKHSSDKFDMSLVEEFFRAFTFNAKITLHITVPYGTNDHHIAEAIFKAVARALKQALKVESTELPSTKGFIA
jgi:imidazoleglycerol-phosphate dehydratase